MESYDLTDKQKHLLRTVAKKLEAGEIQEPLILAGDKSGYHIIGTTEDLGPSTYGDLGALCDLGLMGFEYNSRGSKIYFVRQAGYAAVVSDFGFPKEPVPTQQIYIGTFIDGITGGAVQTIGFADHAQIEQIVNDPELLRSQVQELTKTLLDSVKSELAPNRIEAYTEALEELKQQITSDNPSLPVLRRLFGSLAFIGDLEGTISLAARVWPLIYPLLLMVSQKL